MPGLMRASVLSTNDFSADSYSLTFALGDETFTNAVFWSTVSSALIEIGAVSSPGSDACYQTLITGNADTIEIDLIRRTVGVEGRDLSSRLVDSYRQQDFVNQTASEIAATIAVSQGLIPVVSPTVGIIGRYYGDGFTRLSLGQFSRSQSDWDLIVQLARENDFDTFVQGSSFYFQPTNGFSGSPIPVAPQDVQRMRIHRNLGVSAGIAAQVQSWNSQDMMAYHGASYGDGLNNEVGQERINQRFLFLGRNFTPTQASEYASRCLSELSRLANVLTFEMPWDMAFAPRATLLLLNSGTAFDATFKIEAVERVFSSTTGSTQLVRAIWS
jgi:hypothetical protein